jgi:tetratricopeptide (TPR) repeat protein
MPSTSRFPLARDHRELPQLATDLGRTYLSLGYLCKARREMPRALEWYDRAVQTLTPLLQRHAAAGPLLRDAHKARAVVLALTGEHARALPDLNRTIELDPNPAPQLRIARAAARCRLGDRDQAVKETEEVVRAGSTGSAGPPNAEVLRLAASVYALAAAVVERDMNLSAAVRLQSFERYASRAVELLRRAETAGYFRQPDRVAQLRQDPDLLALRSFTPFQQLLLALDRKSSLSRPRQEQ